MSKQQQAVEPLVFFQLSKVDEAQRLVYGRAVQEVPDRVGEIFDYESSKPFFKAWAASQFEASLGKSNGNVRAMHKDVAAGIIVPGGIQFHDDEKAIDICSKCVDDQEWEKVLSGAYTGYSIGGRYVKKWEDPDLKKTRYTADPSEVSYVDRPCVGTATFFEIQKADGTVMQKNFVPAEEPVAKPTRSDMVTQLVHKFGVKDDLAAMDDAGVAKRYDEEVAKAAEAELAKKFPFPKDAKKGAKATDADGDEHTHEGDGVCKCEKCMGKASGATDLSKSGDAQSAGNTAAPAEGEFDIEATPDQVEEFCKLLAVSGTKMEQLLDEMRKRVPVEPTTEEIETKALEIVKADHRGKVTDEIRNEAREALKKIAERKDADPKEGKAKYGAVKFADPKNKKYPIDTADHIRAAWNYIHKAKNAGKYDAKDVEAIKSNIVAAWKEKIDKDGPPAAKIDEGELGKAVIVVADLRKNLALCAEFASLIGALASLQERVEYEEELEQDDTELPARMMNAIVDLGDCLSDMVKEEVAEHAEEKEASPEAGVPQPVMAMAEAITDLVKRAKDNLAKYGARNSKKDASSLQKAHDALNMAGARCNKAYIFPDDEPGNVTAATGTVNVGSNNLKTVAAAPNDKAQPTEELQKAFTELGELRKVVERLSKDNEMLKAQPMPPKVRLRAIGKGEDVTELDPNKTEVDPVTDDHGEVHKAATSIKEIHKSGGAPLFKTN